MRKWLLYFEAVALIALIVLIVVNTKRGGAEINSPPASQAGAFIEQGDEYFEKQDLPKALFAYWEGIQAMETDTDSADQTSRLHAHLRVSEIYFHSNWTADAEIHLNRAAAIDPDHPAVHLLRGKLLRDTGEQALAVREFLAVIAKDPTYAEAHYQLGVLYQGTKQFEEAQTHYNKAIEHDPDLIDVPFEPIPIGLQARLQLSRTYRNIQQMYQFLDRELTADEQAQLVGLDDKGLEILEEVVAHAPHYTEAKEELIGLLYGRAALLRRGGEERAYDEALDVYQKIVTLDPTEVDAYLWMGQIYNSFLQDPESALEVYRKAYALEPDSMTLTEIKNLERDLEEMKIE
ncbi:hypothetical protein C6502_21465 [Candidatus Poribacteria bacterium]|nr:MAG: hypothetical protein C6502_21465 [Candidatus Poribacteria bacterium]